MRGRQARGLTPALVREHLRLCELELERVNERREAYMALVRALEVLLRLEGDRDWASPSPPAEVAADLLSLPVSDCRHPEDQRYDHSEDPPRFRCRSCGFRITQLPVGA